MSTTAEVQDELNHLEYVDALIEAAERELVNNTSTPPMMPDTPLRPSSKRNAPYKSRYARRTNRASHSPSMAHTSPYSTPVRKRPRTSSLTVRGLVVFEVPPVSNEAVSEQ